MAADGDHLHQHFQWQSTVLDDQHGHVEVHLNVLVPTTVSAAPSTNSYSNNSLAFITPLLLTFVQIKFPGMSSSLFETHHTTTMAAIASLVVYWLALETIHKFRDYADYFRIVKLFSCWLTIASLLAILLPDCWENLPYHVLFTLCWVIQGIGFLRMMNGWAYRRVVEELVHKVRLFTHHHHRRRFRRSGRRLLPLTIMDTHD